MRLQRRLAATIFATALIAGCLAQGAAAQVAHDLAGEMFNARTVTPASFDTAGDVTTTVSCDPAGPAEISFDASGPAVGPYTGTFHETGSIGFGTPPGPPANPRAHLFEHGQARFTIESETPSAVVVGRKTLLNGFAFCGQDPVEPTRFDFSAVATGRYDALIRTAEGTFLDHGSTILTVDHLDRVPDPVRPVATARQFHERFDSDAVAPTPFTKQDCDDATGQAIFESKKECKDFVKGKDNK